MRTFIIATTVAAALFSFPAFTQDRNQSSASLPDLSGLWGNPYLYGIGAPRNTPAEVVEVLNKAVNAGLADPKLKSRLTDLGSVPLPGQPATFGKLIADETEKWGKVIRFAGIKSQ